MSIQEKANQILSTLESELESARVEAHRAASVDTVQLGYRAAALAQDKAAAEFLSLAKSGSQQQADAILDAAQDAELLSVYQARLLQLARAQALAWASLTRGEKLAYLQQAKQEGDK